MIARGKCLWISLMFCFLVINPRASFSEIPDIQSDLNFKKVLAAAIADGASSFDFNQEDQRMTYVLGYHAQYGSFLESRSKEEVQKILAFEKTRFTRKKVSSSSGESGTLFTAILPIGTLPASFDFSLTELEEDTDEDFERVGLPRVDRTMGLRLRMSVNSLMKTYQEELGVSRILENYSRLDSALTTLKSSPSMATGRTLDREVKLASQKQVITQNLMAAMNPIQKIRMIKERISPMSYRDYSDLVFLRVLQEAKLVSPALTEAAILPSSERAQGTAASDPAEVLCLELGGKTEEFTFRGSSAQICRFGEAGVGTGSLLRYKNRESVQSIDAFLNHVPYSKSQQEEMAVIPVVQPSPEAQPRFTVTPISGETGDLLPGIRMIARPSVKVSEYCRQRGGKPTQLKRDVSGEDFKACIFEDFSGIDAKTLFAGPQDEKNRELTSVLQAMR